MITQKWEKLPRCCRECSRIRKTGKKYRCGASLMLPTRKKSCLKQVLRKKHVRDRLVEFMKDNEIHNHYMATRMFYPSKRKTSRPWSYFVNAFNMQVITVDQWAPWAYISTLWQMVLEREYPELVPGRNDGRSLKNHN